MPNYKVTLNCNPKEIAYLKERGAWPYEIGGEKFTETTEIITDDIVKFAGNKNHPYLRGTRILRTDPRLTIEEVYELSDTETTD